MSTSVSQTQVSHVTDTSFDLTLLYQTISIFIVIAKLVNEKKILRLKKIRNHNYFEYFSQVKNNKMNL